MMHSKQTWEWLPVDKVLAGQERRPARTVLKEVDPKAQSDQSERLLEWNQAVVA